MNWQRGDVVLCRAPMPSTELRQFKIRPAVIVSADSLNQILDDVMVIPCTSNTSRSITPTQYLIQGDEIAAVGIRVKSVIRCESIFTLSQSMILRKLGSLSPETMNQVNKRLIVALQL
ncbi:MAG: type II toxin-antitoxin system PemK/MazF family toxin [Leptolyngbyaceae cyanobacterium RM2_2_4]|nr:type II toxin-antitoxin system PemK/MazF family toxin [Leptolyngbyaceae cyanobacterium SM1_4_3]NJO51044.1 type II toxin-antitoxin system PemK/MazF family toxin [Leptolyngbyaceae cyanobacterium RM2_2_4]